MLGIVPKEETNALAFVKANPTYDGRGVTIGIMDTGIDPGAIGLQQTSTGEMKLVDTIDCSGSGDVLLSETVTATWVAESNTTTSSSSSSSSSSYWKVQGLTGRTLKLNPSWKIHPFPNHANTTTTTSPDTTITNTSTPTPTAQVRLGVKSAYELFPKKLVSRVKQYRKLQLDEKQRHHAYLVRKELNELLLTNNNTNRKIGLTLEQAKKKEDLEARLELLEPSSSHEGNIANDNPQPYNDPGPIYDCVVFYDGQHYRAAIDVREDGDLTSAEALADYHKFHQVAQFSTLDMYNYAVNIYDDATVLSIVCDASPHGSHVAGIASAYQPPPSSPNNNNRLQENYYDDTNTIIHNGVAPGAKLVSLKIGDTRLGSMETGVSLVRGLMEAIRLKCDIINLSYGEASALPNSGRFHQLATEAVQRYGIVFVTSAGNNGPALTTTGAPGGTCPSTLSIGAYVSPTMMEAGYSMHNPKWVSSTLFGDVADTFKAIATPPISEGDESKQSNKVITDEQQVGDISGVDIGSSSVIQDALTGSTYTWSSVGPASDGAQGVDVCAPGDYQSLVFYLFYSSWIKFGNYDTNISYIVLSVTCIPTHTLLFSYHITKHTLY
jgi:tripeptidyl-peptidase-2